MKRLSRQTIQLRIAIGLTVLPKHHKRALGLNSQAAVDFAAADMVQRIMGNVESEAVVLVPDRHGNAHQPRHGVWGVDEPHPAPDLPFIDQ